MSRVDFTFDKHTLSDSSFRSNPYRASYLQKIAQNNNKTLESARSTIFSTEDKCTYQSFDFICKELITQQPTFQKADEDSLQKYETIKEINSLEAKIKRLSIIFKYLKRLKQLQKNKNFKKDLSQIENFFLEFQRDCFNN